MNGLAGRIKEMNLLLSRLDSAGKGEGGIMLIGGETGTGKTALAEEVIKLKNFRVWSSRCKQNGLLSYGPLVEIIRNCIDDRNRRNIYTGPFAKYLPILMPELGDCTEKADETTINETLIQTLLIIAEDEPALFFIDDIQWADNLTMNLLTAIADRLINKKILILCTYRTDEPEKDQSLRKLKTELKRRRKLNEIVLEPLNLEETAIMLEQLLGEKPEGEFTGEIFSRTQGLPLFIEEIINALKENGGLKGEAQGITIKEITELTIPAALADVVLSSIGELSSDAVDKLETAALTGFELDPNMITAVTGNYDGMDELFAKKILIEKSAGRCSFRNKLMREALESRVTWSRKKIINRKIAAYYEMNRMDPAVTAEHWLSAGEYEKARQKLVEASRKYCRLYAYKDASVTAGKALDIWPEGADSEKKIEMLFMYAGCQKLAGKLNESVKALSEIIEMEPEYIGGTRLAEAYREISIVYSLLGSSEESLKARLTAAGLYYEAGMPAESSADMLIAAGKCTAKLKLEQAYQYAAEAAAQAKEAGCYEIETQARGLCGNILAMQGRFEEGEKMVQEALSDAVRMNLSDAASIIYRRLASALEYASDYTSAKEAYFSAYNYCVAEGKDVSAQICLGCMSYTLFQTGDWKRSLEICNQVINNKKTPEGSLLIGHCIKGLIYVFRGEMRKGIKHLNICIVLSRKLQIIAGELTGLWGLALAAEFEGEYRKGISYYKSIFELWEQTQDKHDILLILIWGLYFCAKNELNKELVKGTETISRLAALTGNPEALAGLAFALGENAAAAGNYKNAALQYGQALEYFKSLNIPLLLMLFNYRAGAVYIAAGDMDKALKHLQTALSTAKNLGMRPFMEIIVLEMEKGGLRSGESRREDSEERKITGGLTRRQSEILELIGAGLTNKEIANRLFLSARTVDMHVSNLLQRLNCRTRIEAVNRIKEKEVEHP